MDLPNSSRITYPAAEYGDVCPLFRRIFTLTRHPTARLAQMAATLDSRAGRIEASWERTENGFAYRFTLPAETHLTLPGKEPIRLAPGKYEF